MRDFDETLDLLLERRIAASPDKVWRCWTEPELLTRFFAPRPWTTPEAVIEPRPGGRFFTRMAGPDGEGFAGEGCVLVAETGRAFGWTDALRGGYRPNPEPFMAAFLTFEPDGDGTLYRAHVLHNDEAARKRHEDMGFHGGWGTVADQLGEVAATL